MSAAGNVTPIAGAAEHRSFDALIAILKDVLVNVGASAIANGNGAKLKSEGWWQRAEAAVVEHARRETGQ